MRLQNVFTGRPAYYDRTPSNQTIVYSATVAPAGSTVRASYTVPTGRKAMIESSYVSQVQATVATTAGESDASVTYTTAGGSVANIVVAIKEAIGLGTLANAQLAGSGLMMAGDIVKLITQDLNTGGTIEWNISSKIFEFDA